MHAAESLRKGRRGRECELLLAFAAGDVVRHLVGARGTIKRIGTDVVGANLPELSRD